MPAPEETYGVSVQIRCKCGGMTDTARDAPPILVADDDPAIRDVVRFALERAGFPVIEAANGAAALRAATSAAPALIVLDIRMPELDGIEVCRRLRRDNDVPILFLSSMDDEVDRVVGLEIGADDYLVKPFSPRELVARVKAILRRPPTVTRDTPPSPAQPPGHPRHGHLTLDLDRVEAAWAGQVLPLTATEFGILRTLLAHPGHVYSRDRLMDGAYAVSRVVSDRTIDSHIRRLRAKFAAIGAEPIETVPGFGYRIGPCV